jgi:lactoylglutathione lyase
MDLGNFSISLSVKDMRASRAFYERLGFSKLDGDETSWLILQNGDAKIGLFHGLFEGNILTFNPPNVRAIQKELRTAGVPLISEADETTSGPASMTCVDPDGNAILFDQF